METSISIIAACTAPRSVFGVFTLMIAVFFCEYQRFLIENGILCLYSISK